MSLVPCLCFQRICRVCQQPIDDEAIRSDGIRAVLFGHAAYAMCCCCGRAVYDPRSPNYRRRWRRWRRKQEAGALD